MPCAQPVREDGHIPASMMLLVKAYAIAGGLARDIQTLARDQNPNVPVSQVQPLDDVMAGSISNFRTTIRVFISFAAAAIPWQPSGSMVWSPTGSRLGLMKSACAWTSAPPAISSYPWS